MSPIVPRVAPAETVSWASLVTRTVEIGADAAEVMVRRCATIWRDPWSPSAVRESGRMVVEKATAAGDAWLTMCQVIAGLCLPAAERPAAAPAAPGAIVLDQLLITACRMLEPAAAAVSANLARLREGAAAD